MSPKSLRLIAILCLGLLLFSAVASPVSAHAYLTDSTPAEGEQLDELPDELVLSYSGDGVQVATVEVRGPDGGDVSGEATIDADDRQQVAVPLSDGGEGMYIVEWEVLADDGHTTSGTFFFSIGEGELDAEAILETQSPDSGDDGVSLGEAVAKALLIVGLIGVGGLSVAARVAVFPVTRRTPRIDSAVDSHLRRVLAVLGVVLFVGVALLGGVRLSRIGTSSNALSEFLSTTLGEVWVAQLLITGALSLILLTAVRGRFARRFVIACATVGGLFVALSVAWTSHSAANIDRLAGTAVDFVHLVGAGLWVGGLGAIALSLWVIRTHRPEGEQSPLAAPIIRRFSLLAIAGVALLVSTGLTLAAWHIESASGLETTYGTLLAVKLGLVTLGVALGAYNRFILLPRLDGKRGFVGQLLRPNPTQTDGGTGSTLRRLTTSVRIELLVLVLVLVLSAAVTAAAPAATVIDEAQPQTTLNETVGNDVTVEITATPVDLPDEHLFMVLQDEFVVFEATVERDGEPVSVDGLSLQSSTHDLGTVLETDFEGDDGYYTAVQAFPEPGVWNFDVRGEFDGSFDVASFGGHVHPVAEGDHVHDHDDDDHDHGGGTDTPFQLVSLMVLIYGALGLVHDTSMIRN